MPEPLRVRGFRQVMIETCFDSPALIFLLAPTGNGNENESWIQIGSNLSGHFVTVHTWHSNIQYRYVRAESRDGFQRRNTIMGCTNVVSCRMKDCGQHRR